ncbi:hypothetical protein ACFSTE_00820 [Aquimarina hainanensis]|uniref:DUF4468 domain-containing protein n=1 Tax=Aquimarina hainanensis TaxID=1578017 RepID=A0ABW5N3P0_9FLAO|nr:hypothetical protein [Aquimarina sp. TRL1]QKX04533.1 hypothetical protein HN014_06265 [Aquimarina sp. TRL1]
MKKIFLFCFVFTLGLTSQAQENWSTLMEVFDQVYSVATDVGKETDKVIAKGNVISIVKENGTVSLQKKRDKSVPIEFYEYVLVTTTGKEIKLDKMQSEKVIEKFQVVLQRVKESLKENNSKEVESILNSL